MVSFQQYQGSFLLYNGNGFPPPLNAYSLIANQPQQLQHQAWQNPAQPDFAAAKCRLNSHVSVGWVTDTTSQSRQAHLTHAHQHQRYA